MGPPRCLLALIFLFCFASPLPAVISGLTVQDNRNGDYPTLVRNDGTRLDAINLGHTGPAVVVNGVAFDSAPGVTPSGTNWSATGTAENDGLNHPGIDDVFFSELSAPGTITLTYNNLDLAKTYLVQVFHGEPRDCCATTYSNNSIDTDIDTAETVPPIAVGNSVASENPPATSDLAIVTVLVNGVNSFTYLARSGPGRDAAISAFQIREVSGLPPMPTGDVPYISEFVAIGNDTFQDEDNNTPDWLEIYNPTGADLDLDGYHLTDDPFDLTKWRFPATLLQSETWLTVFASDKDRDTAGQELHTNFRLTAAGDYLALVEPDGTTIVSEFTPLFPIQEAGFSYGVGGLDPDGPEGYFATATPGAANGILITAPLLAPTITPACGSFTTSTTAAITTNVPSGQIRYTTNGSEPTAASPLYTGPLTISSTTHLRARVIDPATGTAGAIASVHFEKLSTASSGGLRSPSTFFSDLPIIVVENFGAGGIPGGTSPTLQTARIAVHEVDPATGRSRLTTPPDACFRIGIKKRGASSEGFPKTPYRVELRDDNDVDLAFPLLGLPEESDWVFNGPWTDKSLIRNPLAFELGRTIGIDAPRTKHFELFLSTNGGDLTALEYVGVYVLMEKIKRDRNRTDIAKLEPEDSAEPEITGGYLFRFEPPGIADDGPRATNWTSVEITEPNVPTPAQRNWLGGHLDQFVATLGWSRGSGANNFGVPNPDPLTGYPAFIDVDSFVHLFIMNELLREQDSFVRSDYMHKDRLGKIHKGPLWDYNLTTGTGCCFDNRNTQGWQHLQNYNRGGRDHSYEPDWFVPLLRCPDFKQKVVDRWSELRTTGVLEVSNLFDVIDGLATPLRRSAIRNFTKWDVLNGGNVGFPSPNTQTWPEQIDFIKDWLVQRMGWIDSQFPGGVTLAASASIAPGTDLPVTAASGTIYYTTDGSDPRLPGGGISPTAQSLGSGGTVRIDSSLDLIARRRAGSEWSAPSKATYVVGTAADATNLAVTELNYHPSDPTPAEVLADPTYRDDDFEFLELKNISAGPIDLSGISLVEGIAFTMPAPAVLPAGGYALLVENAAAFEERYGPGLPVFGVYANKMNNDGDSLRLLDLTGSEIFSFTFNDIWFRPTDGDGYSLVAADESTLPGDYDDPASWGISCQLLGNPGAPNGLLLSQSFDGWKNYHFTPAEIADPLLSGSNADFDLDGIVTLLEFALGLDPKVDDRAGLPAPATANDGGTDYLALTFRRLKKPLGLTYRVEVSSDLANWTETTAFVGPPIDNGDGTETITVRDTAAIDPANLQRFIRLVVSLP